MARTHQAASGSESSIFTDEGSSKIGKPRSGSSVEPAKRITRKGAASLVKHMSGAGAWSEIPIEPRSSIGRAAREGRREGVAT